jgi:hypothetical protein
MALPDPDEIVVGSDGHIYVAPVGTAAPVDVATAWSATWIDMGYATEDGVAISKSRDIQTIMGWQSFFPLRRIVTGEDFTVAFSLMQWNESTVKLALGGGVVTTTAGPPIHYLYTPPDPGAVDDRAVGIEWQDGTKIYRLILARAMVTEGVETNLTRNNAAELPITFGVLGEAGVSPFIMRTNDPAWAAA